MTRRCPACDAVYAFPGSGTLATRACPAKCRDLAFDPRPAAEHMQTVCAKQQQQFNVCVHHECSKRCIAAVMFNGAGNCVFHREAPAACVVRSKTAGSSG